jgi:F0F1-type ATP synthase membrane subunit c/vacuolar-type H+-ATPase subunit K
VSVVLINPNLVVQRDDLFTTGIVYMPIGLAYLAAALRQMGLDVKVIDAYAQNPTAAEIVGKRMFLGLKPHEVVSLIPNDVDAVFMYAIKIAIS